jgi:hypothetical protein
MMSCFSSSPHDSSATSTFYVVVYAINKDRNPIKFTIGSVLAPRRETKGMKRECIHNLASSIMNGANTTAVALHGPGHAYSSPSRVTKRPTIWLNGNTNSPPSISHRFDPL